MSSDAIEQSKMGAARSSEATQGSCGTSDGAIKKGIPDAGASAASSAGAEDAGCGGLDAPAPGAGHASSAGAGGGGPASSDGSDMTDVDVASSSSLAPSTTLADVFAANEEAARAEASLPPDAGPREQAAALWFLITGGGVDSIGGSSSLADSCTRVLGATGPRSLPGLRQQYCEAFRSPPPAPASTSPGAGGGAASRSQDDAAVSTSSKPPQTCPPAAPTDDEMDRVGRVIEAVVSLYGAPHLRPTRIRTNLVEGGNSAAWWSLATLMGYCVANCASAAP